MAEEDKTGIKHDQGKPRYELMPGATLNDIAAVFTYGASKYGDRNWERGLSWGRLFGATMRHLWAWWGGEEKDPESGLGHLEHAAASILMLCASAKRGCGGDDRSPYERT